VLRAADLSEMQRRNILIRLILVNTIYFKGKWARPFTASATSEANFHCDVGGDQLVSLMNRTMNADYADIPDSPTPLQILSLDYAAQEDFGDASNTGNSHKVGFSLVVVLPRAYGDLPAIEKNLNADQLANWFSRLTPNRVNAFLPKFKITQSYDLNTGLQALGVTNAFVDPTTHPGDPSAADFSGMDGLHQLFIAKAVHQTYVSVDEKGTEAAAATVAMMGSLGLAAKPLPPVLFLADHPFLFLIRENSTGSILFVGRLASPPQSPTTL